MIKNNKITFNNILPYTNKCIEVASFSNNKRIKQFKRLSINIDFKTNVITYEVYYYTNDSYTETFTNLLDAILWYNSINIDK